MRSLRSLNPYLWKYKKHLLSGIVFVMLSAAFATLPAQVIRDAFDMVKDQLALLKMAKGFEEHALLYAFVKQGLLLFGGLILGFALIRGVFLFLTRQTLIVMSRRIEFDLKNKLYEQYQNLHLGFYRKNSTGDLMARIGEDVSRVRMYLGPAIMYTASTITMFLFVIITMFSVNVWLTLIVIIPLPILSVSIYYVNTTVNKRSERVQKQLSRLSTFTQEAFSGIRVMKAYTREKHTIETFGSEAEEYKNRSLSLARVNAFWMPVIMLLVGISTLVTIWIGGIWVVEQKITAGNIAEFVIYVGMLTWPITSVGWVTSLVQRAAASQTRLNELLDTKPEITNPNPSPEVFKGNIEFKNVTFGYNEGQTILQNLSFTVPQGTSLAIIGQVGTGKTTIAQLLTRMYDVQSGAVYIDGKDIRNLNIDAFRQQLGYVPQEVFLFSDTIENNIAFGKVDGTQEEIIQAAKDAAVYEDIQHFPEGLKTLIGERGITLSGGQKQRVSIARALLKNPAVLLLDDCLSAVDTHTESQILGALNRIMKNRTSIIISHRISSVKDCDNIIVLRDGGISEQGTHEALMTLQGEYAKLYEEQLSSLVQ